MKRAQTAALKVLNKETRRLKSYGPVKLVLFDVFDTLIMPRIPIHYQYHEEAIAAGMSSETLTTDMIRDAFKPAFTATWRDSPMYGKFAKPPITPEQWWINLIRRCYREAGVSENDLEDFGDRAAQRLLCRFESDEGYRLFPETLSTLSGLKERGIKTSVVSNADPRIKNVLESLKILPLLTYPPTLSWDVGTAKPSEGIFWHASKACGEVPGPGVIMVGDELQARVQAYLPTLRTRAADDSSDYQGARNAGLQARLIRREGSWSDGAMRRAKENLQLVKTVKSLEEIVSEVDIRA